MVKEEEKKEEASKASPTKPSAQPAMSLGKDDSDSDSGDDLGGWNQ